MEDNLIGMSKQAADIAHQIAGVGASTLQIQLVLFYYLPQVRVFTLSRAL
jgi:hypothetical protein